MSQTLESPVPESAQIRSGHWTIEYLNVVEEIILKNQQEIQNHFQDELPNECVGLVWMDGQVQRLINQARSPSRFSISRAQLAGRLNEMDETNVLVCVYHSHPGGTTRLSADDKESFKRQWDRGIVIPWLVVTEDEWVLWHIRDEAEFVYCHRFLEGVDFSD